MNETNNKIIEILKKALEEHDGDKLSRLSTLLKKMAHSESKLKEILDL